MNENSKITAKQGRKLSDVSNRRRATDRPQPLDYVTRTLVREIIENQQRTAPPPRSFIQKLLKGD